MTHNNSLPLPIHAYATGPDQREFFAEEARHLLMLAADKLTAAGAPGQEHHELEISTPEGDVARFTIDYAHGDCDIVEADIDMLVNRLIRNRGYDYAIDFLEELVDAVDEEATDAANAINEAVNHPSYIADIEGELDDDDVDYFDMSPEAQRRVLDDFYRDMWPQDDTLLGNTPEVTSGPSEDDRYEITPMGSQALRPTTPQTDLEAAIMYINHMLIIGGEEPMTEEEEAAFRHFAL